MIRNIIFDIGNVLTDYRWEGFLADKGFDAEMIKKIAKASIMHPLWAEYDRGTWTDEQVLAAFVKDAPELEKELHQAFENIAGMVTPRAYAIPWLQELKAKGYHVYYLSNFSHKAETECAEALNFLPEMEGGILSYKDQLKMCMISALAIRLHRHRKKLRQQFMIFWIKKTRLWCMDIWQMQAMRK